MLTEKVPCDMKKVKIPNAYAFGIFGLSIHKGIETREKKLQKKEPQLRVLRIEALDWCWCFIFAKNMHDI